MHVEKAVRRRFVVYHSQGEALKRQEQRKDARIFSFESSKDDSGSRKFIAAELHKFWSLYREKRIPRRFCEVIEEGRPCRPYFDLEYLTPALYAYASLQNFLGLCIKMFSELFNVTLTDRHFLILESSSFKKLCVHVVIHLPGKRLLPDNAAMKPLVERMRERMTQADRGAVSVEEGNRNVRLYLSSTCGKGASLLRSRSCMFYGVQRQQSGVRQASTSSTAIFFDSLIVPKDWNSGEYEMLDVSALQHEPSRAAASTQSVPRETRRMAGECDVFARYPRQTTPTQPQNSPTPPRPPNPVPPIDRPGGVHRQPARAEREEQSDSFVEVLGVYPVGSRRDVGEPVHAKRPRRAPTPRPPPPELVTLDDDSSDELPVRPRPPNPVPPNGRHGGVPRRPASAEREDQSDSVVEVLGVYPVGSRRDVGEPVHAKRPRRAPTPYPPPPGLVTLDDESSDDLPAHPETPDTVTLDDSFYYL